MDISRFLARLVGLYLIIISAAMFENMPRFLRLVQEMTHDHKLMFFAGFFTIILGLLLVLSHNVWQTNWRVIITIVGWLTLVKGLAIIFLPSLFISYSLMIVGSLTFAYVGAAINFILGCLLVGVGFKRAKRGAR